jgi:thiol:disulfide interchange protein DsbD
MQPTRPFLRPRRAPGLACCALLLALAAQAAAGDEPGLKPFKFVPTAGSPFEVSPLPPTAKVIEFSVSLRPSDPFSEENTPDKAPKSFRRGETFTLVITGKPKPGYHTYPLTQRSEDTAQNEGYLSQLVYAETPGLQSLYPVIETSPEWVVERTGGVFLEHEHAFSWLQDVLVLPDAKPGITKLSFSVKLQVCDANRCLRGEHRFEVPVTVSDGPAVPLTPELEKRRQVKPAVTAVPVPERLRDKMSKPEEPGAAAGGGPREPPKRAERAAAPAITKSAGLLALLGSTAAAAFLMLLTPCVFPMIPITVSFFLKQSEKEHHNALLTAGVYSLTIVVVLAAAVLVLGKIIVDLANSPWINLGLGLVLVFFALSLFGMYEIELPQFLARFTSAHEGRGGYAGAFFMALTFTITSFTCTGPFLGPLLVGVKEAKLSFPELVLAALTYSATFAAPFFVLALFPRLLKALPRSGGWLNAVKVVMGFLELAAALKFLGNMDVSFHPDDPKFFTYETVLCAWIALSVACGLYLLGTYRLPHDTPVENIGVPRFLLATLFLGLAVYMTPALWRKVPQGVLGRGIVSFLPLDTSEPGGPAAGAAEGTLAWLLDYEAAWKQAVAENKLIFIDFTGVNCTNCRANEQGVFPRKDVREELRKYVRVQMYNDFVPTLPRPESVARAERNSVLQKQTFEDVSTPLYVIFKPAKDAPFDGDRLKGGEVGRRAGYISDKADFVEWLKSPQGKEVARSR